ncbi:dihydrodipicolinate synthase family protein [Sediminivirga luteola]|uniref:Dihydrodipicolinate synthase family protein n=1 Tax=Sediminivirga luteola TaxID=1774748 RepID=A0A8J2XJV0_9MICO|nr:dihydrodipicolinate synthase family protein [Sediminivirga luteola]GGA08938.1 dihydrodipicolinate synthase family protein [Sediminivirga luteola]
MGCIGYGSGDALVRTAFRGLSAFPLTPIRDDAVDEGAFAGLVERLAAAGVDSITALGSTGSYAYLSPAERARVTRLAVGHAAGIPVFAGVSALRTSQVLAYAEQAQEAGAAGLLLAPMRYQPLSDDEVFTLFEDLTRHASVPVILYDNPATTGFSFTTELYARIAALPGIGSIKIPGVPADPGKAGKRVAEIRAVVPAHVTIGVSGDAFAAAGLSAGCDAWYSVIGGTVPVAAQRIVRALDEGEPERARAESDRLAPLWDLFASCGGSLRVVAAMAEELGLVQRPCLPAPLQGLGEEQRERLRAVMAALGLDR